MVITIALKSGWANAHPAHPPPLPLMYAAQGGGRGLAKNLLLPMRFSQDWS